MSSVVFEIIERDFQVLRITSSYFTIVAEKGAGTAFVDQRKIVNINKATPGIYHNFEALGTKFCCTSILLSSLLDSNNGCKLD
jgi:hypothetical protein